MPIVSFTPKKTVEAQYDAISKLQEKCEFYKVFRGKVAQEIFIYKICTESQSADGPAMLAVANFGDNECAIYAPEYLTQKQQDSVFAQLLQNVDENDKIVVFSKESYDEVKKYCYGKPVNVKLYV